MRNAKIATGALIAAFLLAALGASQASAAPAWYLEAEAPSRVVPGEEFFYEVRARNVGDEVSGDGEIQIDLPDGVKAIGIDNEATIGVSSVAVRKLAGVKITAEMKPDAVGVQTAHFSISGGGAAEPDSAKQMILSLSSTPEFGVAQWEGHIPPDEEGKLQAGAHPSDITTTFRLKSHPALFATPPSPDAPMIMPELGHLRNLFADTPPGFVGSPAAIPTCDPGDLNPSSYEPIPGKPPGEIPACPLDSIVGTVSTYFGGEGAFTPSVAPIFNMKPPPGSPAAFAWNYENYVIQITANARTDGDLGVTIQSINTNEALTVLGSTVTFWGIPADPSHDAQRCQYYGGVSFFGSKQVDGCTLEPGDPVQGPNPAGIPAKPFLTLPTSCSEPGKGLKFDLKVESWNKVPDSGTASFETTADPDGSGPPLGTTGCDRVPFQPKIEVQPTTDEAETPTGLEVALTIPPDGINNPKGISQSHLKDATVTLPEGMTANPSQANGLEVCTPSQIGLVSGNSKTIRFNKAQSSCPDASQLGEVRIDTPLLENPLLGSVHIAQQDDSSASGAENPFDSTLALYIVAEGQGILVKLAGEVSPDPETGQLVTRFLNNPQQPFERFALKFKGGQRAPLSMPPTCGTYETTAELSPWARPNKPVTVTDTFHVTKGPNGKPCPSGGVPPFSPNFSAGTLNNNAGSYSPFLMRLTRADGEQDMTKFGSILPPGVVGKLAGVTKCSEAQIAAARSRGDSGEGKQEIASPSCPASSQIGRIEAGAGVGSIQVYVPGKIYLAGPYKGAPLSVAVITPAVAGPFDVGSVVVRIALDLDPKTAEVEVDGNSSDPIPHLLAGIPLRIRDLRVHVDKDNFILNPTSCDPSATRATLFGSFLNILDPSDDVPIALSDRFQAANCANLGFKPKLDLKLTGGTKRGGHPGLTATYKPRSGDANVAGLVVRLPRSAFLDQAHIRTICTRVQFAADACPPAAQYGYIRAFTPLLDEPLQGPIWLRSSNNKLPDLVFDLRGIVDVEVATRIDSVRGGIRANVESAPDAPLSKVVVTMQGGKKGLIVNSTNLCKGTNRAETSFDGHNGKAYEFKPVVKPVGCGGKRKAGKRR